MQFHLLSLQSSKTTVQFLSCLRFNDLNKGRENEEELYLQAFHIRYLGLYTNFSKKLYDGSTLHKKSILNHKGHHRVDQY